MKNPNNKEGPGPFAELVTGPIVIKSATGWTTVGAPTAGSTPIDHVDGPITGTTSRRNWGVSINGSAKRDK